MVKHIIVGSVALGALMVPAPAAQADEPFFQCLVRSSEHGEWTEGRFDGVAVGYVAHADTGPMELACTVTVNGWAAASVSASRSGGAALAYGQVSFAASPSDYVEVVATLTTVHGTQTRSYRYFPHAEQPARLPAVPTYGCAIDSVKPGGPSGDNFEGVARGWVTRVHGGPVTIRCYITVDGYEGPWHSTPTGSGTFSAATAGRVTFRAEPWSDVRLVAEATTSHGVQTTTQPYSPYATGVRPVPSDLLPDAVGYGFGCSLRALQEESITGWVFEGVADGYVTDGDAAVSVRCYVQVNGGEADTTPTGSGMTVAATQGRVTYWASDTDYVALCAEATTTSGWGYPDTRCEDVTPRLVPPQVVLDTVDLLWDVTDSLLPPWLLDPTLCPLLRALRGSYGPVTLAGDGDVYIDGDPYWDCPPYDWYGEPAPRDGVSAMLHSAHVSGAGLN